MSDNQHRGDSAHFELWGGVECTVNRVRDNYYDQATRNGHAARVSDFALFQELGIKALRHAILWETVAPKGLDRADWDWPDRSLTKIRSLDVRPIVGLVHHGSGPRDTSLLDPLFPEKLAEFAAAVAQRYPWVADYTPVNEPLTTARFSGLYGFWYPHAKDDFSFFRCLLNQCKGVALAMRAVRAVNAEARLIQTEDLGRVFSTPNLAYQADFENHRRWLTFDLLCGRVDRFHPLWDYITWAGIDPGQLEWFVDNPSPPDMLGVNHYLSSNRFLDEHIERYPELAAGGNGRQQYVDVLAARVLRCAYAEDASALLLEAWKRYEIPLAITECHNGCTREEQMRWFLDMWRNATMAAKLGADIRAVTAWSLLGGFDWNSLVTRNDGHYEVGVFDLRAPNARPTAIAGMLKLLSKGEEPLHPLLSTPGWWKRADRFIYGVALDENGQLVEPLASAPDCEPVRPILLIGGGELTYAFTRICDKRAISYQVVSANKLETSCSGDLLRILEQSRPWGVINTASCTRPSEFTALDPCSGIPDRNAMFDLAKQCTAAGIKLLTFSCSSVFDCTKAGPYVESDSPSPANDYALRKFKEEELVRKQAPSALVVRAGALFGPWDSENFIARSLQELTEGRSCYAAHESIASISYLPDLVNASLDLLIDNESGVWHLANAGKLTWFQVILHLAELMQIPTTTLKIYRGERDHLIVRPRHSSLASERGDLMPSTQSVLERYARERASESRQFWRHNVIPIRNGSSFDTSSTRPPATSTTPV